MGQVQTKWFPEFFKTLPELEGKVIAITGCTSGTGYVAAETCLRKNATAVLLLNRKSTRSEALLEKLTNIKNEIESSTELIPVECDLMSFDSVRKAAEKIREECESFGGLNVLANNAGIGVFPDDRTEDGYDFQIQVNHLSHFLLTQQLMPLLKPKSDAGEEVRIVNHSSAARYRVVSNKQGINEKYFQKVAKGKLGGDGISAGFKRYGQSKLANMVFTLKLAQIIEESEEFDSSKFKSVVAEPGTVDTEIFKTSSSSQSERGIWGKIQGTVFTTMTKLGFLLTSWQTPEDGTMPLLKAMIGEDVENGDFFIPEKQAVGMPFKEIANGKIVEKPKANEENSLSKENQDLVLKVSEDAVGKLFELL